MKIKDKLIHLLGGFTKDEWFIAASEKVKPTIAQTTKPIIKICAKCCIMDKIHQPPDDYLKRELMANIANEILKQHLVMFRKAERYPGESEYPLDISETIFVVEPIDKGENI